MDKVSLLFVCVLCAVAQCEPLEISSSYEMKKWASYSNSTYTDVVLRSNINFDEDDPL